MSITILAEVWRALKHNIDESNLPDAAESMVSILIENDYEASEIKEAFRRESDIMDALRDYNSQFEEEEYEEEEYEEEEYDDDEY